MEKYKLKDKFKEVNIKIKGIGIYDNLINKYNDIYEIIDKYNVKTPIWHDGDWGEPSDYKNETMVIFKDTKGNIEEMFESVFKWHFIKVEE